VCSDWTCSDIAIGVVRAGSAAFTLLTVNDVNCPAHKMLVTAPTGGSFRVAAT